MPDKHIQQAIRFMDSYAQRTGLTSDQPGKRYLWTDAFAVCNYLGLARTTGDDRYSELALKLVEQVHHTLGKHRDDDPRTGWISGMSEDAGALHPTRGGLRIGKTLPERSPYEEFDSQLEWDRDGQYFHYLTKWMHALDQATRATGETSFNIWARELDARAYDAFSYLPSSGPGPRRMVWKMSIDLKRALVPSMGKHDPLDGYITSLQLATTTDSLSQSVTGPTLEHEIAGFADMVRNGEWMTDDPLGLGGLLVDAWRLMQLQHQDAQPQPSLLETLLDAALTGLQAFTNRAELHKPAQYRLAFREFGLSIGLHAVERMQQAIEQQAQREEVNPRIKAHLAMFSQYAYMRDHIENFWLYPEHRKSESWIEHRDINEVMLATSLAPDGMLDLYMPDQQERAKVIKNDR